MTTDVTHEGADPMGALTIHRGRLEDCGAPDCEARARAWVDGDPLMEAIAAAVAELCERSDSGLVLDDPRNIAAAAALAAVRVLGRDRCIHVKAVHAEHHARTGPVDGCPWCLADRAASHPEPVVRPPGIKMAVTLTSAPPVQEIAAALHRLRQQPPGGRA